MKSILVVEDNKDNMRLMLKLLKGHGYEDIIEAVTGEEGVQLALKKNPTLILMDIKLPGIDGVETTERIRAGRGCSEAIIIAVTSFAMTGDRERYLEGGFNGYIEKPIDPYTFVEEVESICQKK